MALLLARAARRFRPPARRRRRAAPAAPQLDPSLGDARTSSRSSTSRVSFVIWRCTMPTACSRARLVRSRVAPALRRRCGSAPADCAARARASPGTRPSAGRPTSSCRRARRAARYRGSSRRRRCAVGQRNAVDLPLVVLGHAAIDGASMLLRREVRLAGLERVAECRDDLVRVRLAATSCGATSSKSRPIEIGDAVRMPRARSGFASRMRKSASTRYTPSGAWLSSVSNCAVRGETPHRAPHAAQLEQRADARQQLARGEGLDDVVVGARVEALDARLLAGARRQQHDRNARSAAIRAHRASRPKPSSCGIMTSLRIRSGVARRAAASASAPSATASTRVVRREQVAHVRAHVGVVVGEHDARAERRREAAIVRQGIGLRIAAAAGSRRLRLGQPAQRLLDERARRRSRPRARRAAPDAILGRCAVPNGMRTRNVVPAAERARGLDRAAVQLHELLHEREADAGALVRAALRRSTRWKRSKRRGSSVAECRRRCRSTSSTRRAALARAGARVDAAVERELERVRQEVEDDLLPHLAVDDDGSSQRRAVDREREPGPLDRRAERARELARQRREIGRLVARLHAAGLDAREVEQRVDEPAGAARCGARARAARATRAGRRASPSASSSGPSISVSGVRNSWLTFEKNAVFARSSSASASARRRSLS